MARTALCEAHLLRQRVWVGCAASALGMRDDVADVFENRRLRRGMVGTLLAIVAGIALKMNRQKLLCVLLMCFGFSLVYAAAQTQPAAGPPAAAPATNLPLIQATPAALPDPQTPEEFFARARQLSDLEASGIPFHLKATYVASGDAEFTGNGAYEEWWQSKDVWRKEATLGDYKYVAIKDGDKHTVYGSSQYIPLRLRQMLKAIVVRIAPDAGLTSDWKPKSEQLNGVDLAVLSVHLPCGPSVECRVENYFTPQGLLRIRVDDSIETLYNGFEGFHGSVIPRSIVVAGGKGEILKISIVSLESLSPDENKFLQDATPGANLPAIQIPDVPAGKDLKRAHATAAKLLNQTEPVYPPYAKQHGIQGTVVIEASIDEDGKVREPFVISSAGPLLDMAAMDAVKKWRYRPLIINGVPISVTTTISVVFDLRP